MCLHCKLFEDEAKNSDMVDSLLYSMKSRIPKQTWKRVEMKGVGDNNGFWEVEIVGTLPVETNI